MFLKIKYCSPIEKGHRTQRVSQPEVSAQKQCVAGVEIVWIVQRAAFITMEAIALPTPQDLGNLLYDQWNKTHFPYCF